MAGGVGFAGGPRGVDSEAVGAEEEGGEGECVGRVGGGGDVGGGRCFGHCGCRMGVGEVVGMDCVGDKTRRLIALSWAWRGRGCDGVAQSSGYVGVCDW